jgi:ADP-ribose pyrophosphatase YjhB (NUDIX family)
MANKEGTDLDDDIRHPFPPIMPKSRRNAVVVVVGVYFAAWATYGWVLWYFLGKDAAGIFGDMFGAFNALVSGIAMLGVVAAIFLQRQQISMQSQELQLQVREMKLQRKEMELTRKEFELQREEFALNRRELAKSAEAQDKSQRALTNAAHSQVYRAAVDILQGESVRSARRIVLSNLAGTKPSRWSKKQRAAAETVCHTYDSVGIMVRYGMLPVEFIADSWGDSLRKTWKILAPLIEEYRQMRGSPEYWDDYQYLALEAEKIAAIASNQLRGDVPHHTDAYVESFTFCRFCGGHLRAMISKTGEFTCTRCERTTFVNPKIGVAVLLTRGEEVLLATRRDEPFAGYWVLPSGYVDYGETCEEAAIREAAEEIGIDIILRGVHGVYSYNDDPRSSMVLVVFAADGDLESVRAGDDVNDLRMFHAEAIPEDVAFQGIREALADWRRHLSSRAS